jgi:hypothetical protein
VQLKINLGAYGWCHKHWSGTFYPEDLPMAGDNQGGDWADDWRLAYYSNEFNSVLIPADYWQAVRAGGCEQWLDSVHDDFQFFVECRESMLENVTLSELIEQLQSLQPQLSALVFLDVNFGHENTASQFTALTRSLGVEVFSIVEGFNPATISMQPVWRLDRPRMSSLACIEDNLSDLRQARTFVEQIAGASINESGMRGREINMIICHPQLQARDLSRFQSVLHIMGY